nr:cupin domain-containing protein [Nocardia abscessus]
MYDRVFHRSRGRCRGGSAARRRVLPAARGQRELRRAVRRESADPRRGGGRTRPHHHTKSTEIFYVLGGTMEFLVDGARSTVGEGGLVVVAPGTVHAFGAAADGPAEFLAVLTPGIVRFEYFRQLGRIARGEADWDSMNELHDRFDVHFDGGPRWR